MDPDTLRVSDGFGCFVAVGNLVNHRRRVLAGNRKSSELEGFHWISTLPGNLEGSIRGTYHGFKFGKYAQRYLAEVQYRFSRRFEFPRMIPRLLYACAVTAPCVVKQLRLAEVCS